MTAAAAAAKSLQSCPTLCDPINGSPPGSPVPGILQVRILEWVAMSFSNTWKWKVKVKLLSCVRLLATPWTAAYHGIPSMGFSRQEYWSGMPLPSHWKWLFCLYFFKKKSVLFIYFTLQYCIGFAIHWHESAMSVHVFPILKLPPPLPSLLGWPSLWVIPVHQPRAPSVMHWTWTGDSFHMW